MNWSIVFFFLFLFSTIIIVVGTKNPKIIFPNRDISKIRFFLGSLFVSFVLLSFSIATSPSENTDKKTPELTPFEFPEQDSQEKLLGEFTEATPSEKTTSAKIINVIDGDTVKTQNGEVIRLIGMDAPEVSGERECYADEATKKLEELVLGKNVELEKDISETDRYNRLLRYIWTGDTLINEVLVREGFAMVATYPPDVKYKDRFVNAQQSAREGKIGLWGDACAIPPTPTSKTISTPTSNLKTDNQNTSTVQTSQNVNPEDSWECDCSKKCAEMFSCAEAQYQLLTCGCSARDNDGDGIACDSDCQ